jgi:capsular polysaccharide biosynthesis protein
MLLTLFTLNILFIGFALVFFIKKNKLEKKQVSYVKVLEENENELQKLQDINENLEMELQFVKDIYRTKLLKIGTPSPEKELA